jgi:small subunit ribosomal protein S18
MDRTNQTKMIIEKQCFFCSQNLQDIDYKDVELLKKFTSGQAKIIDPKHTGTCARHQRKLSESIKRARFMALLPFVKR